MAVQTERGIPLSALNPKFLHTNSTSHTWPFSAIAELIDNAYDPDVSAKQFWIDKTAIRGHDCLIFMDNGAGMGYDKMYKMLSFGFSDKETINGHVPVGLYGNGFKSGSMRLGKDAIVFSKNGESMCVGLLSQTYLQEIHAENVIVPIVQFKRKESELLCELNAISAHYNTESTGTRIIIWNLRKTSTGKSEFDFDTDRYDIQIPSEVYESEKEKYKQPCRSFQSSPESDFSLQAYCSILYLKPKMQIIIRGQKVKTQLISKSLAYIAKDRYKPNFLNRESIPITFGYNTKSKEHYGVMMYHKNRLIKAYERVGCQNKANEKGVGVIAVIECNFLKPTHNKQDFDYTEEYRRTMQTLGVKLEEYWKAIRHKKGSNPSTVPMEDIPKRPDQNWVQCDECLKWRKLPDGIDMNKLPEKWFCRFNPDPQFRRCEEPEEAEDSEDETSECLKKYKQHERNLKKQQEQQRTQMEETRLRQEQQRNAKLLQQNVALKMKVDLVRHLYEKSPSSPRSPTTALTPMRPFSAVPLSQSASSPSDSMPVISNVMSLSTPKRAKRSLGLSQSQTAKRARILHDYSSNTADSPSTSAATSDVLASSPLGFTDNDGNNVDENNVENSDDDDVVIDETHSTPRPKAFDLSKVKMEEKTSDDAPGLYMECSDQAETENTGKEAVEPSTSTGQTSITTQTERLIVKAEEDEQAEIKKEKIENDARGMERSTADVGSGTEIKTPMEVKRCTSVETSRPNLEKLEEISKENKISFEQHAKSDVENQEDMASTSKTPHFSDIEIDLMPAHEAQKQQDNLLDLLEATAQERDELKEQVQQKEFKLLELTIKKDCSHQSIQTDPSEEQHYKALYLKATQSNNKLMQERDELKVKLEELKIKAEKEAQDKVCQDRSKAEGEGHSSTATGCENVDDETALQVDFLLREIDNRNTECQELRSKLESLEQEKANCEQLQKEVEELRKQKEEWSNAREQETLQDIDTSSQQTCSRGTATNLVNGIKNEGEGQNTVTPTKLRELRCSIARLLVTFVPALDLDQVNYDCEVIDEILNQRTMEFEAEGAHHKFIFVDEGGFNLCKVRRRRRNIIGQRATVTVPGVRMKVVTCEIAWHNKEPVYSMDFQQSGEGKTQRLATAGVDTTVRMWRVDKGPDGKAVVEFLSNLARHTKAVNVVRFSPTAEVLASGGDDAAILLWKLNDSKEPEQTPAFQEDEDDQLNKESWSVVKTLRGHIEDVYDISWTSDGNFMVSGSVDNTAIMWDVNKGQKMCIFNDHKSYVQGVAWDPLGQYISTLSCDRPIAHLPCPSKATLAVRCSPVYYELRTKRAEDGSLKPMSNTFNLSYRLVFAVASEDSIFFYDTQQTLPFGYVSNIHYHTLSDLSWSRDGSFLAVSSTDGYCSFVSFEEGELGTPLKERPPLEMITPSSANEKKGKRPSANGRTASPVPRQANTPAAQEKEKEGSAGPVSSKTPSISGPEEKAAKNKPQPRRITLNTLEGWGKPSTPKSPATAPSTAPSTPKSAPSTPGSSREPLTPRTAPSTPLGHLNSKNTTTPKGPTPRRISLTPVVSKSPAPFVTPSSTEKAKHERPSPPSDPACKPPESKRSKTDVPNGSAQSSDHKVDTEASVKPQEP
ncbi:MORC family CW-type zinc finger 3 [Labeo rohita]|uniref:Chromatin assembly factor 1 subunit B n=1 Tax=Labeo rohita TaxID=84645 RepID=A0A498NCY4_LABRO|nr:MORC family CW-type zinc finger 3 [Labeo rohita]